MKDKNELKEIHGSKYADNFIKNYNLNKLVRLLPYMKLSSKDQVVDFACGNGMLMPLLASKIAAYHGVDFSLPFIEAAEEKKRQLNLNNAFFYCTDIGDFCRDNAGKFDVGFAMDFSEHVYDEDWLQILKSIRLSLKSGGRFYMHTPNAEFFLELMRIKGFILKQRVEHIAVRSLEENITLLSKAGFSSVNAKLIPHYNVLRSIHLLSYLPLIGRYFKARIFIEAIA